MRRSLVGIMTDPMLWHGRRCPVCSEGLVRVVVSSGLVTMNCDRCAAPGRQIAAKAGIPYSALEAAVGRWAS